MADPDPRFEVENEQAKKVMRDIALLLAPSMPPGFGFCLFVFEFSGPAFFWISNADRSDMIKALKEFIHREQPQ